jgi:hypothetical protein
MTPGAVVPIDSLTRDTLYQKFSSGLPQLPLVSSAAVTRGFVVLHNYHLGGST